MRTCEHIEISAVARFFSAAVIKELAKKGKSPLLCRLVRESGMMSSVDLGNHLGTFLDHSFDLLKYKHYRHEYVYKAALTQRVLLGKHSLNTASMLTEFRVGNCKADLVILNGTGTVYEIKSERDTLSRLEKQIEAYMQVFAKVNVIVGENHLDSAVKILPDEIGILRLSDRFQISSIRDGIDAPERTNPVSIFESITTPEAELVLSKMGLDIPDVPNTIRYQAYRDLFKSLDPSRTHRLMVETLKKTRNLAPLKKLVTGLPKSLHAAVLTTHIKQKDHLNLISSMDTTLGDVITWN